MEPALIIRNAGEQHETPASGSWMKRQGNTPEPRRWPRSGADAASITDSMKAGADVPGVTPFRAVRTGQTFFAASSKTPGNWRPELTLPVKPNAKSVTFKLKLKPGSLTSWRGQVHTDAEGTPQALFYACDYRAK